MAHDVIATCPVCSGELAVTRLRCSDCGTTIEGERIEVRGCDLWTFDEDGKLTRKDAFWKIREPT